MAVNLSCSCSMVNRTVATPAASPMSGSRHSCGSRRSSNSSFSALMGTAPWADLPWARWQPRFCRFAQRRYCLSDEGRRVERGPAAGDVASRASARRTANQRPVATVACWPGLVTGIRPPNTRCVPHCRPSHRCWRACLMGWEGSEVSVPDCVLRRHPRQGAIQWFYGPILRQCQAFRKQPVGLANNLEGDRRGDRVFTLGLRPQLQAYARESCRHRATGGQPPSRP